MTMLQWDDDACTSQTSHRLRLQPSLSCLPRHTTEGDNPNKSS